MNQDKTLTCRDCGAEFVFTAAEQDFFAEKGFTNEPGRCPECRAARKQQNSGGRSGRGKGSTQSAPTAEPKPRFPSVRVKIVPFTAATASVDTIIDDSRRIKLSCSQAREFSFY